MASNPSFVEDNDEDFFDKLVNDDDDDHKPSTLSLKDESNRANDNDSDNAKAFANLGMNDVRTGLEDLGKVGIGEEVIKDCSSVNNDSKEESANISHVESNHLVSSNSMTLSSVNEEPDENQNHGIGAIAGVKEVQWSDFGSDSMEINAFGSYTEFFNELGDGSVDQIEKEDCFINSESNSVVSNSLQVENVNDYSQQVQSDQVSAGTGDQQTDSQDRSSSSSQYWENLYPGWRYDPNTGQWFQVDESYNESSYAQRANNTNSAFDWTVSDQKPEVSYLQQSVQSIAGSLAETGKTESITNWNSFSVSQSNHNNESLSNWNQGSQDNDKVYPSHMVFDPQYPGWYYDLNAQQWCSLDDYNSQSTEVAHDQVNQIGFGPSNTYYKNDQGSITWQPNAVANNAPIEDLINNQQVANQYGSSYDYAGTTTHVNNGFPALSESQPFVPYSQPFGPPLEQSETLNVQNVYGSQNQLSYLQQPVQSGHQIAYASSAGRSSAGRPPHALVTFGFGGKLIVMKDSTAPINASYGGQDSNTGSISVLSLAKVVTGGAGVHDYLHALCHHSFPGPLSGGNVGSKELNKWIDDRITHTEPSDVDHNKGGALRLLLSLLKIASQHYGKLRSPFGSDAGPKENNAPEVDVARLFASMKNSAEYNNYGAHCLQQVPSEGQTQKEALLRAQEGQLWGPALVLAAQLGDQFYVDTAKKMALSQLVPGSPLRTLCLLIAGQPADVFAADAPGSVNMFQQPTHDNLAVITANRTKDDELVLIHLGDRLWKERSNILAAHICYLVAEANFEPYSDSARLCLIGADHLKHPRTFVTPEAIQRTEVYEYAKLLGNSQFTLLPFQPYKLIYAHMLAEVGRVSDSLKYCQAVIKSLKTGRIPEVETWRRLAISLEDRIKIHQQGGFSSNLAPSKIVGKLLNLFDSTAHRVVGGTPPPAQTKKGRGVINSQSTMTMSSLITSPSMESIYQVDGNRRMMHNRSASEPDFGRSSKQDQDEALMENSADSQRRASGNTSRFGRFGFGSEILKKTVNMVLKSSQDKQAKLGGTNKFYYDEKLKRWVEEGVDSTAEEAALPPPPTMASFQNGSPDYNLKTALRNASVSSGNTEFASPTPASHTSRIPLVSATTNQFSAGGRTGVRTRYVDTFNQGGRNRTNLFQSPSVSNIKPKASHNPNPNFFVPTAAPEPEQQAADITRDNLRQHISGNQTPLFSSRTNQSETAVKNFASMDDMSKEGSSTSTSTSTSSFAYDPMSRRPSSWSGSVSQDFSVSSNDGEQKPVGGMPRCTFFPNETGCTHLSSDDLLEVEL